MIALADAPYGCAPGCTPTQMHGGSTPVLHPYWEHAPALLLTPGGGE